MIETEELNVKPMSFSWLVIASCLILPINDCQDGWIRRLAILIGSNEEWVDDNVFELINQIRTSDNTIFSVSFTWPYCPVTFKKIVFHNGETCILSSAIFMIKSLREHAHSVLFDASLFIKCYGISFNHNVLERREIHFPH